MVLLIALASSQLLFDCNSIPLDQSEVAYQKKISKHKKPITCLFEAQITIHFFQYLKDIIS